MADFVDAECITVEPVLCFEIEFPPRVPPPRVIGPYQRSRHQTADRNRRGNLPSREFRLELETIRDKDRILRKAPRHAKNERCHQKLFDHVPSKIYES